MCILFWNIFFFEILRVRIAGHSSVEQMHKEISSFNKMHRARTHITCGSIHNFFLHHHHHILLIARTKIFARRNLCAAQQIEKWDEKEGTHEPKHKECIFRNFLRFCSLCSIQICLQFSRSTYLHLFPTNSVLVTWYASHNHLKISGFLIDLEWLMWSYSIYRSRSS